MTNAGRPPLDEATLIHFGVKGMKWGRRKSSDSSGSANDSKKTDPPMSTGKKVAIGSAVLGGAAITAILLSRSGSTSAIKIGKVDLKPSTMDRLREAQKMKVNNLNLVRPSMGKMHYFDKAKNAWAVAPGSALATRGSAARTTTNVNMGNISDVRRAWNDPNHVWVL